jgi:cytochrome c553
MLLAFVAAACVNADSSSEDRFAANGELIALSGAGAGASNACFTCHGLDGRGNGAGAPRLAGLDVGYLERQMRAYADGRRQHPQMGWIADRLSQSEHLAVSDYYARIPYTPDSSAIAVAPPILYVRGDPARGLQACAACHGLAGQGLGAANPAIGGQPADYIAHQLHQWRQSKRRTDPGNVMLRISQLLTAPEIAALSAYSARLPGGLPRPEYPAASRAGRRDDPRNDASAPPPRAVAR